MTDFVGTQFMIILPFYLNLKKINTMSAHNHEPAGIGNLILICLVFLTTLGLIMLFASK
jgi:hypothetical protein